MTPGYKAPKKVDLQTLQDLDADDEALVKYKATLLGETKDVKGKVLCGSGSGCDGGGGGGGRGRCARFTNLVPNQHISSTL